MAEHLSLITTPIELLQDDSIVSRGTGFYYVSTWGGVDHIFLVTNYHVLTGNEVNKKEDEPKGNKINFFYHLDKKILLV